MYRYSHFGCKGDHLLLMKPAPGWGGFENTNASDGMASGVGICIQRPQLNRQTRKGWRVSTFDVESRERNLETEDRYLGTCVGHLEAPPSENV